MFKLSAYRPDGSIRFRAQAENQTQVDRKIVSLQTAGEPLNVVVWNVQTGEVYPAKVRL